ncbi:MAG TPA: Tex family protein [Anaerolineaceae bacterium]|nr:Tex family protein [Anaerolineaceae bacterium]
MIPHVSQIASQLNLKPDQVSAAVELLDGGNTVPFIARYRKEVTGTMDEEQLRQTAALLEKLRTLDDRRTAILASIEEQGKLTPELRKQLDQADSLTSLEDLYQPYRPKRRTRASIAREKGLQGLADIILQQPVPSKRPEQVAQSYLNDQVTSIDEALAGARDIVAETISDHPDVRRLTRQKALQSGTCSSKKIASGEDARLVYETYYDFNYRIDRLRPHQVLALNRGESEKVLRVKVEVQEKDWQTAIHFVFKPDQRSPFCEQLLLAMADAAERLLLPAIERDVRRELTEKAETQAINVFATNLRALLTQPPLSGYTVMGIDPGFRTGSKVAVVDPTGKVLATETIYPHEPHNRIKESLDSLKGLSQKHLVNLASIGNGTASRETEQLIVQLIKLVDGLRYVITSEAGASVYSASPLARAELPGLDVSMRGAVSIARRVQDPLAELVKIEPKAIGVGMYQHDVDQAALERALAGVVESVVNQVGVDVNTASPALLAYIAGIGPKLAERIVAYRDEQGIFKNRTQLREVSGLGPKAFEQSAGFLRIRDGDNPLDASAIHPESYAVTLALLKKASLAVNSSPDQRKNALDSLRQRQTMDELAAELGCGLPTLNDIVEQLLRPGRDPRQDLPVPILRSDVLSMEDLADGMHLKGTVRNVVDFGAFVDIGVKQDGLLHRSQFPVGTVLHVGDIIDLEILKIEPERGRISLKLSGD